MAETIATAAAAALAARQTEEKTAEAAAREALIADARRALVDFGPAATADVIHVEGGLVIVGDVSASIAVQFEPASQGTRGTVSLVEIREGQWTKLVEVASLADVGAALAKTGSRTAVPLASANGGGAVVKASSKGSR